MNHLKQLILDRASAILPEIISLRRHLHANPELSYNEYQTEAFISNYLSRLGIDHKTGIGGTGIIGYIRGASAGGRVVALRAEMDALPINEENDLTYKSSYPGVMHACGHDAHMAMLMGTAVLLNEMREEFHGTVILIFQPGEEKSPGGASLIIGSGALDNPAPDVVLAQHVLPEMDTGCVGYRAGTYMTSADEIYITVKGRGGHAALTNLVTDQIYIASQLIVNLKDTIAAEQKRRDLATVFGIGKISGCGATNVIPVTVEIAGTLRTYNEDWRREVINIIRETAARLAEKYGVEITVTVASGYPVLVNDEGLAARAAELSSGLLGSEKVISLEQRMTSDDFSFYTEKYPSLYYRVGLKPPGAPMKMLHTTDFNIDESGMQTGIANMTWLALNFTKPPEMLSNTL